MNYDKCLGIYQKQNPFITSKNMTKIVFNFRSNNNTFCFN